MPTIAKIARHQVSDLDVLDLDSTGWMVGSVGFGLAVGAVCVGVGVCVGVSASFE